MIRKTSYYFKNDWISIPNKQTKYCNNLIETRLKYYFAELPKLGSKKLIP